MGVSRVLGIGELAVVVFFSFFSVFLSFYNRLVTLSGELH